MSHRAGFSSILGSLVQPSLHFTVLPRGLFQGILSGNLTLHFLEPWRMPTQLPYSFIFHFLLSWFHLHGCVKFCHQPTWTGAAVTYVGVRG